jgi:hypothetical protein
VFHLRGACSKIIRDNRHRLFPVFVFRWQATTKKQGSLQTSMNVLAAKILREQMEETVHKSVHDAFIDMNLGKTYERLDRRLYQIVDRLAVLETQQQAPPPPPPRPRLPNDAVFDEEGNYTTKKSPSCNGQKSLR